LGLETRQLNRSFVYPSTGREANQIDTLAKLGMFTTASSAASTLPAFVSPFGSAPLEERARVYLNANCSNCHRGDKRPSLRFETALGDTRLCDAPSLLVPGHPETSRIVSLMKEADPTRRMPKNAGGVVDPAGVKLVEDWVTSRATCP
jgi:hypothetical protein